MPRKSNKPKANPFDPNYAPYGTTTQRGNPAAWKAAYEERMMDEDEAVAVLDKDSPYTVLGLSIGADKDAIKTAFRTYSKKWHPDINKSPEADAMFKKGHAAYSLLMGK